MTLRYIFLTALILTTSHLGAQGLVSITDEDGGIVNGTVVHHPCQSSTDTVSFFTSLSGSSSTTVNVRRYEMWPIATTWNFYCWGVCYIPQETGTYPTWVSQDPVNMNPGAAYNNFHAYHQAQGINQTARYRFVWFDVNNPLGADSSWVDIDFCGAVGIDETVAETSLRIWPSPSNGRDLQVAYTVDGRGAAQLVVYNVLGSPVRRLSLGDRTGRSVIGVSDLVPGVYFANLERDGRMLVTQRLVVAR